MTPEGAVEQTDSHAEVTEPPADGGDPEAVPKDESDSQPGAELSAPQVPLLKEEDGIAPEVMTSPAPRPVSPSTDNDEPSATPPPESLRKMLERTADQQWFREWVNERWWPSVNAEHDRIGPNRVWFFVVRGIQVAAAAALPVFATAGTLTSSHEWGWATVGVSLLLAVAVAFDQVYRPGIRWRHAYETFYNLTDAAWRYVDRRYREQFPISPETDALVKHVEAIIVGSEQSYLRDIANLNTASNGTQTTTNVPADDQPNGTHSRGALGKQPERQDAPR